MLVRLTGDQAAKYWDFIKYGIEIGLPPVVGQQPDRMSNILTAILTDQLAVWVSVNKNKSNEIDGFVVTSINTDVISGTKSMLIYVVYGISQEANKDSWVSGFETLRKFAASEKCHRILAYSDIPSIIEFAKHLGGEARYTLLSLPL